MFLTVDEVVELTAKHQRAAQVRALRAMGINHILRADGSPAVLRETIYQTVDRRLANGKTVDIEPDFSAVT